MCRECSRLGSREERRGSSGEHIRAKSRERWASDMEFRARHTRATRAWSRRNPEKAALYRYRAQARNRNLEFSLPEALFFDLISDNCFYCGAPPSPLNSVDRVDSTRGYVEDNVVTACFDCNQAKMDLSRERFEAMCCRVADMTRKYASL